LIEPVVPPKSDDRNYEAEFFESRFRRRPGEAKHKTLAFQHGPRHALRGMFEFLRSIMYLVRPYRFRMILGVIFGVIAGLVEPLLVLTVVIVYKVIFPDSSGEADKMLTQAPAWLKAWIGDFAAGSQTVFVENPRRAFWFVSMIPAVFLVRGVVGYLNQYLLNWVAIRVVVDLRQQLFTHLMGLSAAFFGKARSGELMTRILMDTDAIRGAISSSVSTMVKDPITIIVMATVLLRTEPRLTLLSLIVLPVCIVPISIYSRKGRKAASSLQEHAANVGNLMVESFTGHRIIKAYNLESVVVRDFKSLITKFASNYMRLIRALEAPGPMLEFAGSVGVAFLLGYAVQWPDQRPTSGSFLLLVISIIAMYRPIKSMVRVNATLQQGRAASLRVFELLATKTTMPEPANPKPLQAAGADIHFDNVSFSYDEKLVLQDIQLTVKAGTLYALVGSSGSGKTTLTNLLLRFYDPTSGSIRIGSTDIREVATRTLRDQIAVVTQETVLFNDTIRNNIALGRPGATEEEIIAAAKHAHAHEFISRNPEGYNLVIGERGSRLSVGQRQRLTIARALLKNAPILILDEATSALDTESERIVQAALEELMVGRTTICIAHRLSTIQKADVIVALHDGRIAEMGTHDELLARGGVYSNLHKLQFGK
jgi:ATP-binding cassette, subfamily B, bacterial MsbA